MHGDWLALTYLTGFKLTTTTVYTILNTLIEFIIRLYTTAMAVVQNGRAVLITGYDIVLPPPQPNTR